MRQTFPIPACCTRCGHQADIFVDDELLAKALEEYRLARVAALWRPLLVRRMFASWIICAGLGGALGFVFGVLQ